MTDDALREEHREYLMAPWQWRPLMRRVQGLTKTTRYILSVAADYAGKDGTEVMPGVALLAVESESSYEQVKDALREGRRLGLLFLAYRGNRRRGLADVYWLIAHPELLDRAVVEDPATRKLRAEKVKHAHRRDTAKPSPSVTDGGVEEAGVRGHHDPVHTPITGSDGPRTAESLQGHHDPVKAGIQGPGDPLNDRLRGLGDPPTSPTKSDLPAEKTSPPDDLVLHGPVTLRARDAESNTDSPPVAAVLKPGPYDRAVLAAQLAAAKAGHAARAAARANRTTPDSTPGETALDRLTAAVAALTPPATPA